MSVWAFERVHTPNPSCLLFSAIWAQLVSRHLVRERKERGGRGKLDRERNKEGGDCGDKGNSGWNRLNLYRETIWMWKLEFQAVNTGKSLLLIFESLVAYRIQTFSFILQNFSPFFSFFAVFFTLEHSSVLVCFVSLLNKCECWFVFRKQTSAFFFYLWQTFPLFFASQTQTHTHPVKKLLAMNSQCTMQENGWKVKEINSCLLSCYSTSDSLCCSRREEGREH